ncbi:hypothetical protein P4H61_11070 [Paenibacillus peoriae]|nr:hypothetical protein [Paenibacillus peoriae]MEC0182033.1 hypothetical protein [Paenibacillus peoriae]
MKKRNVFLSLLSACVVNSLFVAVTCAEDSSNMNMKEVPNNRMRK